ncbi:hypothetical protein ES705_36792 [subsurface metagenome]
MTIVKKCEYDRCFVLIEVKPCLVDRKKYCSRDHQNKARRGKRVSLATEYKKGSRPASWVPVGSESIARGYMRVKVAEPNVWRPRSHIAWEKEYGRPLPQGWIVRHVDGDPLNDAPENLVAMSRGQHLIKTLEDPEIRERAGKQAGRASTRRRKERLEKKLEEYDTYYWQT